ncbi:MAG: hypothetical protein ACPGJS_16200 [Flammeovirgaceae bacterium]
MKQLIVIFLLSLSCTAWAQDSFQKELFSTNVILKYRTDLGLSDAQVTRIKKIYSDHITQFNTIKWDLDAELQELSKLLAASKVAEDAAMTKMKRVIKLEDELKLIRLGMLIKTKNALTESQQNKLKQLRTEKDMKSLSLVTAINDDQDISIVVKGNKVSTSEPLYLIVDGKEEKKVSSRYLKSLKPSKIESITVFKGEKATKLYGNRGKNGVIVIQLKK